MCHRRLPRLPDSRDGHFPRLVLVLHRPNQPIKAGSQWQWKWPEMDGVCRQTGGHSGPARSAQRAYLCPPLPARRGSRVVSASMPGRRETLLGTLSAVAAASGASGAAGAAAQLTSTGTVPGTRPHCPPPPTEVDSNGIERLVLQPQGWETWSWRGHKINFLAAGSSGPGEPLPACMSARATWHISTQDGARTLHASPGMSPGS